MIDAKARDAFWRVVGACLVQFHKLSPQEAEGKTKEMRARIESPPVGMSSEIFYHAEPFDVACDIAKEKLDLSKYWKQYDSILGEHNW